MPRKPSSSLPVPFECEIQRPCLDLLELRGIPHMRLNAGGGYRIGKGGKPQLIKAAAPGWSDIIGWFLARWWSGQGPFDPTGRFFGCEVKRPGERPTPAQFAFLRRLNADGCYGFWVNDVSQLERVLDGIREGKRVELNDRGDPYLTDEAR